MAGSYYKKIKGKNYDKELLDLAEFSVRGAGDGRISLDDAEKILDKVKDANEYTEIEKRTIHYIRDHFKFTKQSDAWFRKEIRSWAATKKSSKLSRKTPKQEPVRSSEEEWPILAQQVRVESRQNENKKKLRKTILVLLIAILLALGLYFLFSNFFCRKDSVEKVEKENSTSKPGVLSTSETKKEAPVFSLKKISETTVFNTRSGMTIQEIKSASLKFDLAEQYVNKSNRAFLRRVAAFMKDNPNLKLLVKGYTCNQGTDESNIKLSQERAFKIADYLYAQGVPINNLKISGEGKANPIADNSNNIEKAKNRRVEFELMQ